MWEMRQSRMALMSSCQPPNEGLFRFAVVRSIQVRRDIRSGGLKPEATAHRQQFYINCIDWEGFLEFQILGFGSFCHSIPPYPPQLGPYAKLLRLSLL